MDQGQKMNPELLSKLQNLSIKAKYVVEGFMIGLHKSPYHGFSVEFSEHRPYGIGAVSYTHLTLPTSDLV